MPSIQKTTLKLAFVAAAASSNVAQVEALCGWCACKCSSGKKPSKNDVEDVNAASSDDGADDDDDDDAMLQNNGVPDQHANHGDDQENGNVVADAANPTDAGKPNSTSSFRSKVAQKAKENPKLVKTVVGGCCALVTTFLGHKLAPAHMKKLTAKFVGLFSKIGGLFKKDSKFNGVAITGLGEKFNRKTFVGMPGDRAAFEQREDAREAAHAADQLNAAAQVTINAFQQQAQDSPLDPTSSVKDFKPTEEEEKFAEKLMNMFMNSQEKGAKANEDAEVARRRALLSKYEAQKKALSGN